ncbi:hypothetical protein AAVH_27417 [Aphelenchoides avenae]|nr:hypothetical protein AAVH_27417 [Aphelenchus avenae]
MSEIWTFFHKTQDAVKCNGCAYEIPNTRDSLAYADALWTHLSSAHRDVYERSHHFETNASATFKKVHVSPKNLPSEIWKYFTKIGTGLVQCNLCSHVKFQFRKSTDGLWGHMKSAHMDEFKQTLFFKSRSLVRFHT